mgnify:CR=1 FL=1
MPVLAGDNNSICFFLLQAMNKMKPKNRYIPLTIILKKLKLPRGALVITNKSNQCLLVLN